MQNGCDVIGIEQLWPIVQAVINAIVYPNFFTNAACLCRSLSISTVKHYKLNLNSKWS